MRDISFKFSTRKAKADIREGIWWRLKSSVPRDATLTGTVRSVSSWLETALQPTRNVLLVQTFFLKLRLENKYRRLFPYCYDNV